MRRRGAVISAANILAFVVGAAGCAKIPVDNPRSLRVSSLSGEEVLSDGRGRPGLRLETLLDAVYPNGKPRAVQTWSDVWSVSWTPDEEALRVNAWDFAEGSTQSLMIDLRSGGEVRQIARANTAAGVVRSRDGSLTANYDFETGLIAVRRAVDGEKTIISLATHPPGVGMTLGGPWFAWSPRAHRLAYARILHCMPSLVENMTWPLQMEIRVFDADSGSDRRVYLSPHHAAVEPADFAHWPNVLIGGLSYGKSGRIYFSVGTGVQAEGRDAAILSVEENGAEPELLASKVANNPSYLVPAQSPDGRYLAFRLLADPDFAAYEMFLENGILDLESKQLRVLSDGPLPRGPPQWSALAARLFYICKPGAFTNTLCVARAEDGQVQRIKLEDQADIGSFSLSRDERRVAWVSRDVFDVMRVRVASLEAGKAGTLYERPFLDLTRTAQGEVKTVRWRSFDGMSFEGALILPVGQRKNTRPPLIVDVHGGPTGGVRLEGSLIFGSPLSSQVFAAKGYAVFLADYRKGLVSGPRDHSQLQRPPDKLYHEDDALDILYGVRHLIDQGVVDPSRIAIIGHSYGSTVINQLLTLSDLFKAAVSYEGTADYRPLDPQKEEVYPAYLQTRLWVMNATPENLHELETRNSPVTRASRIRTPLLFVAGSSGDRDGMGEKRPSEFVNAINAGGGQAELFYLPDSGHAVTALKDTRLLLDKVFAWLDGHIMLPAAIQ